MSGLTQVQSNIPRYSALSNSSSRCKVRENCSSSAIYTDTVGRRTCSCTVTATRTTPMSKRRSFLSYSRKLQTSSTSETVPLRCRNQKSQLPEWSAGKKWVSRIATPLNQASVEVTLANTKTCISTQTCFSQ